eukprot:m.211363 g.211363  ORF g.211363 m.211363 type:complete len:401 (-) comp19027_c0_seq6:161-1363(-)
MAEGADSGDKFAPPFHDEESFKAWMASGKHGKQAPLPDDFKEPDEKELEYMKQLKALLRPEHQQTISDLMLSRFVRGYILLQFANADDKVERAAAITNLALDWYKELKFETELPDESLPRRDEFEECWPLTFPGETEDKRVVMYSMCPADLKAKFTPEEVGKFHAQDLSRLLRKKRENMEAHSKKFTGNHHVVVIDLGWEKGSVSRELIKFVKSALMHKTGAMTTQHFCPDALAAGYLINTPFWMRAVWSIAKLFLEATTATKYHVLSSDYMSTLEGAGIRPSSLPMCANGTAPNPPRLQQTVKASYGASHTLTMVVPANATTESVTWTFTATKNNCDFVITATAPGADAATEVGKGTVEESGSAVQGSAKIIPGSTVVFLLDNTKGSYSSHITYQIDLA